MVNVNRFRTVQKLGTGGMGVVWLVYDTLLEQEVAVKKLRRPNTLLSEAKWQSCVNRLVREAQALRCLKHRNIVTVYDVIVEGGLPSIVMEYIRGKSLDRLTVPGE